jgi:uncharacterized repeat protein (TIGR03803 family)
VNVFDLGVVFKLKSDGSAFQVLHLFQDDDESQRIPTGALVEGSDGALYGTTNPRATNTYQTTVFKLAKNGTGYKVLHSFDDISGDFQWVSGLATSGDGVLYGTVNGRVFRLKEDGTGYQILHDGAGAGPLLLPTDGLLYGTAGGGLFGWGTIFRLSRDGSGYQVIHNFAADEWEPQGALVEGLDGALYGALSVDSGLGSIFRVRKDGSGYQTGHEFEGAASFLNPGVGVPLAGLVLGPDGLFYGTTSANRVVTYENGGWYSGTVFKLWPPETPDLISVLVDSGRALVSFTGESGYRYQVLRSTNLTDWQSLGNINMPSEGSYTFADASPLPSAAWYRIAWLP